MADLKIGVMGAGGRMGGAVIRQVADTPGCVVVAACEGQASPALGRDAGELAGIGRIGVVIDSASARWPTISSDPHRVSAASIAHWQNM